MDQLSLIIMAAGMGSRYGGSKQTDSFGPSGELLMDYAIYNAMNMGFGKVVIVCSPENRDVFLERYRMLKDKISVETAIQQPPDYFRSENKYAAVRQKPWGTAHALLSAADSITGPAIVINADDHYHPEVLKAMATAILHAPDEKHILMAGYMLSATLSGQGRVSRALVLSNRKTNISELVEAISIGREPDGRITGLIDGKQTELVPDTRVSMNCWAIPHGVFSILSTKFNQFLHQFGKDKNAEFQLPAFISELLQEQGFRLLIIPVEQSWFGVTFAGDKTAVQNALNKLIAQGIYLPELWN
jgi:UTP-glucose-1-phosphate uridylyltransferase